MPTVTYEKMLAETLPKVIETSGQYDSFHKRFGDLVGKGRARTADETAFMKLLGLLIEDYDRRHALPPLGEPPAKRLRYILETAQKTPADLVPIFGQRSHVSEALKGNRPISADQARKLGKMFRLNPGYFL